jgi:hypothetical protein
MPSRVVTHPKLGTGKLLKTYMGGYNWEVQFDSGKRYTLPAHQFTPESTAAYSSHPAETPYRPLPLPPDTDQFRDRQTLEALRMGIVPVQNVEDLTIGLATERVSLERALARSAEQGGDAMAIIGDYGFGKSHFVELTARTALARNFVVASASLDLVEVPPAKAREIYRALVRSIRYPGGTQRGLGPLLRKAVEKSATLDQFVSQKPIPDCPLSAAIEALTRAPSESVYESIVEWISGEIRPNPDLRSVLKKPPTLYATGEVARQYTYLLTAISALAVQLGYSGLAVLIDESEHYSLLKAAQRQRADSFFKSLIYASLSATHNKIDLNSIPNHTRADYPVAFAEPANLFFLFASTESESRMPIEAWLSPSQIVRLDDRFLKEDIDKFFRMVLRYHSVAYRYTPARERYLDLVTNASSALSRTLGQHRINLRELIRLTTTICDLLFLYPDYGPHDVMTDLARGLGV